MMNYNLCPMCGNHYYSYSKKKTGRKNGAVPARPSTSKTCSHLCAKRLVLLREMLISSLYQNAKKLSARVSKLEKEKMKEKKK